MEHVERLSKDLRRAAHTMSEKEIRFLVDAYYIIQEDRKRSANQVRAMMMEPHSVLLWFADQNEILERQIKAALESYAEGKDICRRMMNNFGVGPVIAAGLSAHVTIRNCNTAGKLWAFAGLAPPDVQKWEKGKRRPWNAALKTLCWKIGQSFMKFHKNEACYYGHVYRARKDYEEERNNRGGNAARAAELLPKFSKSTEAYKHLKEGRLPPGQIDARARRYAVKLFLSHLQQVWFKLETGEDPPKPFAISRLGHADYIPPPDTWGVY
jgi:hypothetical protein